MKKSEKNVEKMIKYAVYEELSKNNKSGSRYSTKGKLGTTVPWIQVGMIFIAAIGAVVVVIMDAFSLASGEITAQEVWENDNLLICMVIILLHSGCVVLWRCWLREKVMGKRLEKEPGTDFVSSVPVAAALIIIAEFGVLIKWVSDGVIPIGIATLIGFYSSWLMLRNSVKED